MKNTHNRGVALVMTLVIVAMLTVILIAFMSSVSIDRRTATAFSNIVKSEEIAEAGLGDALQRLLEMDSKCTITAYENSALTDPATTAPYLVGIQLNPNGDSIQQRYHLYSSRDASGASKSTNNEVAGTDWIDINSEDRGELAIGLPDASGARQSIPVPWLYVVDASGKKRGRYAFWIDDESAKVNVAISDKAGTDHTHLAGKDVSDIAIMTALQKTYSDIPTFFNDRQALFPSSASTAQILGASADWWQQVKSNVTSVSRGDERGALGTRRLNINDFANQGHDYATDYVIDYKTAPGRAKIVDTVRLMASWIQTNLPQFGTRFYTGIVTADDQLQYITKLATNVVDYIDKDSQPTVIAHGGTYWADPPAAGDVGDVATPEDGAPYAFGKEAIPYITEYMGYYYVESGAFRIDHTFEVNNPFFSSVSLQNLDNPAVLMSGRNDFTPPLVTTPGVGSLNPPLRLPIPTASPIPPGRYALLTTLPASFPDRLFAVVGSPLWIQLNRGETSTPFGPSFVFLEDSDATAADADTRIAIVNDYGYLDFAPRVAQQTTGGSITAATTNRYKIPSYPPGNDPSTTAANKHRGYPLDSGDPRSQAEGWPDYDSDPVGVYSSYAWKRNSANSIASASSAARLGGDSYGDTFGMRIDNNVSHSSPAASNFYVPEPALASVNDSTDANAYQKAHAVIRNGAMKSIGELGYIYDPAIAGPGYYSGSVRNRAGMRTLSIGSNYGETAAGNGPNPLTQATDTARNRAFDLLEIFTALPTIKTSNTVNGVVRNLYRPDTRGQININSVLRDPQAIALKSVMLSMNTQDNSDETAYGKENDFAGPKDLNFGAAKAYIFDNLLADLNTRAQAGNPITRLGQIGELASINTGTNLVTGVNLTPDAKGMNISDRGKEEFFRRIANLICLKGSVFTIHIVAEAGEERGGIFRTRAVSRLKTVVELEGQYPDQESSANVFSDNPFGTTSDAATLFQNNRREIGKLPLAKILSRIFL